MKVFEDLFVYFILSYPKQSFIYFLILAGIFVWIFICNKYRSVRQDKVMKHCTEKVNGVCISRNVKAQMFNYLFGESVISYSNTWKYTFDNKVYKTKIECSEGYLCAEIGEPSELFINPDNPTEIFKIENSYDSKRLEDTGKSSYFYKVLPLVLIWFLCGFVLIMSTL